MSEEVHIIEVKNNYKGKVHYNHAAYLDIGEAVVDKMVLAKNGQTPGAPVETLLLKQHNTLFPNAIKTHDYSGINTTDPTATLYIHPDLNDESLYSSGFRGQDGKIKLKLVYPDVTIDGNTWELIWKQTTIPSGASVTGFETVWTPSDFDARFGGLDTSHQG